MLIKKVGGTNFRNLLNFEIEPHEKTNIIYGKNAQGKTNLLELIWLFTGAKSFRTNKDSFLINEEKEEAKINLLFEKEKNDNEAEIRIKQRRTAFFNEKKLSSPSSLAGNFCAIVFSPDDLSLISGSPEKRRRFLDIAISQIYPKYIEILKRYTRAMAQRNYVLKNIKERKDDEEVLYSFEKEMAESGKNIIKYRKRYLELCEEYIKNIYSGISHKKEEFSLLYEPCVKEEVLLEKLKEKRKEDILNGYTSVGPHRDDIDFIIDKKSVKNFGSQGQKRSVALALKLSEAEVLNKINGEYPVALLDDVFSELDPERQNFILNHIDKMQVFITCCDPANIKNLLKGSVFKVINGNIEKEK